MLSREKYFFCQLKHSNYELRQSPRYRNHALDNHLKDMGFKQTPSSPCLYIHSDLEGENFGCLCRCHHSRSEMHCQNECSEKFKMKNLEPLHQFLGIKIIHNHLT